MKRIEALDGLRGIAALVVVFHHCALALPAVREQIEATYILRPLVAGPQAVYVFFVLSGLVLYPVVADAGLAAYPGYLARRIGRLYPPLAAIILISAAMLLLIQPTPPPGLSRWYVMESWHDHLSPALLAGHLLLLDPLHDHQLDNAMWSLIPEIRIALVFPLLAVAARRAGWTTLAITFALGMAGPYIPRPWPVLHQVDLLATLQYVYLFVAGAILAVHRQALCTWGRSVAAFDIAPAACLAALILLSAGPGLDPTPPMALGATLLVATCLVSPRVHGWLTRPIFLWLGRISYSLYLVHLPVMLSLIGLLGHVVPPRLLLLAVPPLALAAAALFHRTIERPSIVLGTWLGQTLSPAGRAMAGQEPRLAA